jgi:Eukaryotic aspartyl protease
MTEYTNLYSVVNTVTSINLAFSGITIPIPTTQLVIGSPDANGNCFFGISKGASAPYIIGDDCLSAIYAVYDLDNNQISLAPALFGVTSSNILQIMAGPGGGELSRCLFPKFPMLIHLSPRY